MIVSAVRDPYPTRDKSEGALIRRAEPVVYSEWTEDSPLTKEQMAQFERDGYLVLTDVFSAHELNELRAAAERVTAMGRPIPDSDLDRQIRSGSMPASSKLKNEPARPTPA